MGGIAEESPLDVFGGLFRIDCISTTLVYNHHILNHCQYSTVITVKKIKIKILYTKGPVRITFLEHWSIVLFLLLPKESGPPLVFMALNLVNDTLIYIAFCFVFVFVLFIRRAVHCFAVYTSRGVITLLQRSRCVY